MCISSLFAELNDKILVLDSIRPGLTGYLDMVDTENFSTCRYPEMARRGMDGSGRLFYSFFLSVWKKNKADNETKWRKTDCIYTFFQRYHGEKKVALCTSHLKPDYSHVFLRAVKKGGNPATIDPSEEASFRVIFQVLLRGEIFESESTEDVYPIGLADADPVPTEVLFRVGTFQPSKNLTHSRAYGVKSN